MIKIYNRLNNEYEIENVAGNKFLEILYNSNMGKIPLNLLVKRKIFSDIAGFYCNTKISKKNISSFVQNYKINMNESLENIDKFKTFNDFFVRKLKVEAREYKKDRKIFISPGDGRLKAWENINIKKLLQIKGNEYNLVELINDHDLANDYQNGTCFLLRLAPIDYHRFHFVDDGIPMASKRINGHYYSVNPVALNAVANIFCQNKREYCIFKSANFDQILYVEVGATSVGSIVQTYKPEVMIKKGDEKGFFKFGGSTIIFFIKKGLIKVDDDILEHSDKDIETRIFAGDRIGLKI